MQSQVGIHGIMGKSMPYGLATLRMTALAACSVFLASERASTTIGRSIGLTHGSA